MQVHQRGLWGHSTASGRHHGRRHRAASRGNEGPQPADHLPRQQAPPPAGLHHLWFLQLLVCLEPGLPRWALRTMCPASCVLLAAHGWILISLVQYGRYQGQCPASSHLSSQAGFTHALGRLYHEDKLVLPDALGIRQMVSHALRATPSACGPANMGIRLNLNRVLQHMAHSC